jgi:hypothetical protein
MIPAGLSAENVVTLTFIRTDLSVFQDIQIKTSIDYRGQDFSEYQINQLIRYDFQKKENIIRRAEVIFFGSLTIVSFMGWLTFSLYNMMIYGDTFGSLRREQFLTIYMGSGILSLAVSISDILAQHFSTSKTLDFK